MGNSSGILGHNVRFLVGKLKHSAQYRRDAQTVSRRKSAALVTRGDEGRVSLPTTLGVVETESYLYSSLTRKLRPMMPTKNGRTIARCAA